MNTNISSVNFIIGTPLTVKLLQEKSVKEQKRVVYIVI